LFPHGVLFRAEESILRKNLLNADLIDCVIGLGANLFYNSMMEACIVICRTNKPTNRRGKILLINAINEVTRRNTYSWLEELHIKKIADTYDDFADVDGFAKVITASEAEKNGSSLSISLYVRETDNSELAEIRSAKKCASLWLEQTSNTWTEYGNLAVLLGGAVVE